MGRQAATAAAAPAGRRRRRFHLDDHPWIAGLGVCHLVFFAIWGAAAAGLLQPLDLAVHDAGVRARADAAGREERVVAIGFDEADIQAYGYPLSDQVLADLLRAVLDAGAHAVGVDIYRDIPVAPGSAALAAVVAENPHVLWVYKLGDGDRLAVRPHPVADAGGQIGFADLPLDRDETLRRGLLSAATPAQEGTGLALLTVLYYLAAIDRPATEAAVLPGAMQIGDAVFVPLAPGDGAYARLDAGGYQMLLDYALGERPFRTFTMREVLEGAVPPAAFDGRIVLIGAMAESVKDDFVTPFTGGAGGARMPGVLAHAQVASQLLRVGLDGAPAAWFLPTETEALWLWLWAMLGGIAAYLARPLLLFVAVLAAGLAVLGGLWYLAFASYLWVPAAPAALAWIAGAVLFNGYLAAVERARRSLLTRMFNSHVSESVAAELWRNRDAFQAHGRPLPQRLTATVMFTDINGFTPISERMTAEELMAWLNDYMGKMAQLVMERGGIVDKFIGDAVMAVFGVPVPRDDPAAIARDARAGVDCAFAMERALRRLNAELTAQGLPNIRISIGLYTGELVAGSLGSTARMEYTVIGDTVNTAARLEAYASKEVKTPPGWDSPCRIVIGAATWDLLEGAYEGLEVGEIKLKGKDALIKAYLLTGPAEARRAAAE